MQGICMKRFKKVYVEITNVCNLRCPFCIGNTRKKDFLRMEDAKILFEKLKPYTNYLYFHLMGEPLMHPQVNELIDVASKDFYINLTTNGYCIERIAENKNIRQINISLHSYDAQYDVSLEDYCHRIFITADQLHRAGTIINYRLWVSTPNRDALLEQLNQHYGTKIDGSKKETLGAGIYFDTEHIFTWPSLEAKEVGTEGKCYALKDHIGVLVDGTVVPCCLDSAGVIALGNLFQEDMDTILHQKRVLTMLEGFACGKKVETLCQKCDFIGS